MAQQKIRIRLKGYDHTQVDLSARSIVETAQRTGATVSGPVPLPTEKNVYCVIRWPLQGQGFARALRDPHAQAADRHPPADAEDGRLADAARPAGRRRHRDQALEMAEKGIIGTKLGMTQIFDQESGKVTPVTVMEAGPCPVVQVKTPETDGYTAVQLAFGEVKEQAHLEARGRPPEEGRRQGPHRHLVEIPRRRGPGRRRHRHRRGASSRASGSRSAAASKGKGFAGTIKRHNFSRGPTSHGSHNVRKPGSIGASATPSRVFKGMRMSGHMGDERVTQRGLRVAEVDAERNLLLIAGAVPGLGRRRGRDQERRLMAALVRTNRCRRRRPPSWTPRSSASSATTPSCTRWSTAELAARRQGTHVDQDPRPGGRRPCQAVAPEGHRPRPPGHDPRPAVDRRRRRVRPAPAQLHRQGQPQGARQGAADRALGPRAPTAAWRRCDGAKIDEPKTKARAVELLGRLAHRAPAGGRRPARRGRARPLVPQPASARTSSRPASSRSADLVWARSLIVSKAALALLRGG